MLKATSPCTENFATEKISLRDELIRFVKQNKRLLPFFLLIRRLSYRTLSFFNNRRKISNYLKSHQTRKLQIGSGENVIEGWLNTDRSPTKKIVFLDASKRFPFNDCTFDYVLSEHLIEHLTYQDGLRLVQECYRVLKPGGKIRISTPDLRFLIELYNENRTELQERYVVWAVKSFLPDISDNFNIFVINNFFRNFGHKFIYDYKTLRNLLDYCRFVNMTQCSVGESNDKNFKAVESHNQYIGNDFNKLESLILEGTKPL